MGAGAQEAFHPELYECLVRALPKHTHAYKPLASPKDKVPEGQRRRHSIVLLDEQGSQGKVSTTLGDRARAPRWSPRGVGARRGFFVWLFAFQGLPGGGGRGALGWGVQS